MILLEEKEKMTGRNMHTLELIEFCYLLHAHSISLVAYRNQIGYTLE